MTATYEAIATTTLTASASTVTFTSISQSYTDLVFVQVIKSTATGTATDTRNLVLVGNNTIDTGTNYSSIYLNGNAGGNIRASRETGRGQWDNITTMPTQANNEWMLSIFYIQQYTNTSMYKTVLMQQGQTNNDGDPTGVSIGTGTWRSTSAINQVRAATAVNGNFATGSTFTLYGIKAE